MSNHALDPKAVVDIKVAVNTTTKLQRESHSSIPDGSIFDRLMNFAFSVSVFEEQARGTIIINLEISSYLLFLPECPDVSAVLTLLNSADTISGNYSQWGCWKVAFRQSLPYADYCTFYIKNKKFQSYKPKINDWYIHYKNFNDSDWIS